jgi:hypothetical protein
MNIFFLEPALDDLAEMTKHFDEISARLGLRFRQAVEKTLDGIREIPKSSAYHSQEISRAPNHPISKIWCPLPNPSGKYLHSWGLPIAARNAILAVTNVNANSSNPSPRDREPPMIDARTSQTFFYLG